MSAEGCPTCDRPPGTVDPDWQCLRDKYDAAVAERDRLLARALIAEGQRDATADRYAGAVAEGDRLRAFVYTVSVSRYGLAKTRSIEKLVEQAQRVLRGEAP